MKASQTAQFAAAHRAYHARFITDPLLNDAPASWLLGPPLGTVLSCAPLRWLFWRPLLRKVGRVGNFVVIRSRYVEDGLAESMVDGCRQYLILGAGLDSWALRCLDDSVRVFEVDLPGTQAYKRQRIVEHEGEIPPNLSLIPIDFETQSLTEVLQGSAFDPSAPVYVSWLGTAYYLTEEAIRHTFRSLAQLCAPGSRVVFDYFLPKEGMGEADRHLYEVMDEGGTKRGEPLVTLLSPEALAGLLEGAGLAVSEDLNADAIRQRYLSGREDGLDIPGFASLCTAVVEA